MSCLDWGPDRAVEAEPVHQRLFLADRQFGQPFLEQDLHAFHLGELDVQNMKSNRRAAVRAKVNRHIFVYLLADRRFIGAEAQMQNIRPLIIFKGHLRCEVLVHGFSPSFTFSPPCRDATLVPLASATTAN